MDWKFSISLLPYFYFSDGFISGGFDGSIKIYDDIWMLSLPSLQWQKLTAKLPEPVYFHASAITPVSIFSSSKDKFIR